MSTPNFKFPEKFFRAAEAAQGRRDAHLLYDRPPRGKTVDRRHRETGTAAAVPVVFVGASGGDHTFSLSFRTSFRLATTIPVSANRAMTLGSTIRLLNISVSSQTKSLPDTVPRKMNTSAITV